MFCIGIILALVEKQHQRSLRNSYANILHIPVINSSRYHKLIWFLCVFQISDIFSFNGIPCSQFEDECVWNYELDTQEGTVIAFKQWWFFKKNIKIITFSLIFRKLPGVLKVTFKIFCSNHECFKLRYFHAGLEYPFLSQKYFQEVSCYHPGSSSLPSTKLLQSCPVLFPFPGSSGWALLNKMR